ncbi:ribosome small subunit-dependent GTPase A [Candidatus Arthromitus sp. SFB-rat-Yit]|uniref:ribosome small subunit-dependent GTPase A n=1 Tax=Candidatus Arthromitus sp. SFB-rat-Yit TaxID=1041504 RepID=UPI000227A494|nr:ribosome small subunit-dependent GTPase A [Candidatus Arthromitus sp. SFB-rat-Yit]
MDLKKYGFNSYFEQESKMYEGFVLARVIEQHLNLYKIVCENGERLANVSGKFRYLAINVLDYPAVGDWVMVKDVETRGNVTIHHILKRSSVFVRQSAGTSSNVQVVVSNIDIVFICMSLNDDFNLRRLERYLTISWDSQAKPVIILTKSDLCKNIESKILEVETISIGVEIFICSYKDDSCFEKLKNYICEGQTVAFIGSSGVGKSTIINKLIGKDFIKTNEIRESDDKGKHTTTYRQLILLPSGGVVIDTPGMRELSIYSGDVSKTFEDIEEIVARCKFRNCTHSGESGCAVRSAIMDGIIEEDRFINYKKLKRELGYHSMNCRQREQEKLNRMFGGKKVFKEFQRNLKKR